MNLFDFYGNFIKDRSIEAARERFKTAERSMQPEEEIIEGENEGEVCNREGCKGEMVDAIVDMKCYGGMPIEINGIGCNECEIKVEERWDGE